MKSVLIGALLAGALTGTAVGADLEIPKPRAAAPKPAPVRHEPAAKPAATAPAPAPQPAQLPAQQVPPPRSLLPAIIPPANAAPAPTSPPRTEPATPAPAGPETSGEKPKQPNELPSPINPDPGFINRFGPFIRSELNRLFGIADDSVEHTGAVSPNQRRTKHKRGKRAAAH